MVLAVIFSAAAVVGAIETVYQVYQLTVIDAAARGLKHPKLWGLLAANGNNSSGLLLYLIGRRNYPVNSMDSRQVVVMEKRKKTAGIGLVFVAVGAIGLVLCLARVVSYPNRCRKTARWRAAACQEISMEFLRTAPAGAGQAVTCSTSGMGLRLK